MVSERLNNSNLFMKEEVANDLNEITRLVGRIRDLRNESNKLEKESNELVEKFIEKHSEFKPVIGKYSSYIDTSINPIILLDIIKAENDLFLSSILLDKNKSLTKDSKTIDPYVDRNIKTMEYYGELIEKFYSIEYYSECNLLLTNQYLITDDFRK